MAKEFKKNGMSGSGPVSGGSTSGTKGNGGPSIGGDAVGKGASAGLGAIGVGVSTMIDNQNTINNLMNLASELHSGIMTTLIGLDITQFRDFNDKNGEVMRFHMMRNAIMKELLHDGVGAGAYIDGNPYNDGTPVPDYSYSHNYSYRMFSGNVHIAENNGQLTTSHRDINDGSVTNKFFDYERNGSSNASTNGALQANVTGISGTGSNIDKDSLLYKTKRLFQANKINSIISQFHTSQNVRYDGQVGSDKYGESHGRNLLTKSAENGGAANMYNGFDNPYCRVWTHHYTYDRLSKTMRANPMGSSIENSINYWGKEFEWNENDVGHTEDKTNYGDGEKYDYAWRGHHNQQRRRANSVLDESTGLVTIAPKFDGGGSNNVHTKACMFSIENLAWKDYDPYSFEQALSWEQRGPLGGRIMWFPPYNLKVTETNTAKWSQNEFIGRGESVYTYVNSDRSGTLTFTMLVDHPSSIDYASWYDTSGVHSDNDYHRYFAGCFDGGTGMDGKGIDKENYGDVINNKNGVISPNGGDNLLEVPTNLTDEYTRQVPNKIQAREHVEQPEIQEEPPRTTPTQVIPEPEPPKYVEFYTFFPNNYSGVYDRPLINENQDKEYTQVDAILYLLMGNGAQKKDGFEDLPLSISNLQNVKSGYEMSTALGKNTDGNYVNGYAKGTNGYVISSTKKWYYRIDSHLKKKKWTDSKKVVHEYGYATDNLDSTNTIGQTLLHNANYTDAKSYKLNSDITHIKSSKLSSGDNLYSFSDIACAMYSEKLLNNTTIYEYLKNHSDSKNVEELINIFTTMKLTNIECSGSSNEHGANASKTVNQKRNQVLADNRGKTLISWLRQFANFANAPVSKTSYAGVEVAPEDKSNENGLTAKLNRNVHIKLEFSSIEVKSESQTDNTPIEPEPRSEDAAPVVGGEFNERNWVLIIPGNVEVYTKAGYHYTGEDNPDINDKYAVTWREGRTPIKWAVYHYENNGINQVSVIFNNYIGLFDNKYQYKIGDICFYNNEFYVSKYDFFNDKSDFKDENGKQLKMLRGNEYKNYHGFRYLGSKEVGDAQWHYYLKEPGMTYFEEDNSINENTKSNSDKPTDDNNIEISLSQLKTVFNSEPFQPSSAKYAKNQNINNTQTTTPNEVLAFNKYDNYILEKIGLMTCKGLSYVITEFGFDGPQYRSSLDTVSTEFKTYTLYGRDVDDKTKSYDTIYKDEKIINKKVNLVDVANEHIDSIYGAEDKRVQDVYSSLGFSNAEEMKKYISLINILEHVDYIADKDGNRTPVCQTEEQMEKLMIERRSYDQNSDAYEKDCNNVWVDTGDGLLIKECELTDVKKTKNLNRNKSLNKLRYDQEYHFYKKYMADHPFVLEKLREKIKYFNPAFHSMTPEGFNGRLTFLNQCTRQGATMTRSDALAGTTANNLAFGRPPFCVLRLGDFYHQMIVIESINYNYDVSGGLQWDLNTEGNGVQPMLCEVLISFKFIGGGDITGPVRRLQNAMSFNYYANTSFYDNRADRAEYQDTNWETMGGGGNNKVDANKSYSYLPNLYEDTDSLTNITRL